MSESGHVHDNLSEAEKEKIVKEGKKRINSAISAMPRGAI